MSNNIDFRVKSINNDKESFFNNKSIHQEEKTILNVYVSKRKIFKLCQANLIGLQKHKFTITVVDFDILFSIN
jgi:hypothetical protein